MQEFFFLVPAVKAQFGLRRPEPSLRGSFEQRCHSPKTSGAVGRTDVWLVNDDPNVPSSEDDAKRYVCVEAVPDAPKDKELTMPHQHNLVDRACEAQESKGTKPVQSENVIPFAAWKADSQDVVAPFQGASQLLRIPRDPVSARRKCRDHYTAGAVEFNIAKSG